jgi:hypothetical protein
VKRVTEADRIRENRLRRMAGRQSMRLLKSRRRDPYADGFGTYMLVPASVDAAQGDDGGFGADLDEIERQLKSKHHG